MYVFVITLLLTTKIVESLKSSPSKMQTFKPEINILPMLISIRIPLFFRLTYQISENYDLNINKYEMRFLLNTRRSCSHVLLLQCRVL